MKKTRSGEKAAHPSKPVQGIPLSDEKEDQLAVESHFLSPKRISEGASTTTPLLEQILAQPEDFHPSRYWGINE
jgi:hypothetical protein